MNMNQYTNASTKLYQAVLENNENEVKVLLYDGIDLNFKDALGKTLLYIAAEKGYLSIFKQLLDKGANIEVTDSVDETCFHIACRRGKLEIISTLLQAPFRSRISSHIMNEALHIAIDSFRLELVSLLLTHGADPNAGQTGKTTLSPLHKASKNGYVKMVELLLEYDICRENIDKLLEVGAPIHLACRRGKYEVVQILIKYGANKNLRDAENNTPLHLAIIHKHIETVKVLLSEGADSNIPNINSHTALHVAVTMRELYNMEPEEKKTRCLHSSAVKLQIVESLLENGSLPNIQDIEGNSSLHIAIINGYYDVIPALIKHNANVNIPNLKKSTPLHLAIKYNCGYRIIELMLKAGGDTNMADEDGNTSLHLVALTKFFDIINLFLKYKTNPNIQNNSGDTPFHIICGSNCTKTTENILNYGGDPNIENMCGDTPLHVACTKCSHEVLTLILEKGGNPNMKNKLGETPVHKVVDNVMCNLILEVLLKHQADLNVPDNNGNTPVHKIYTLGRERCVYVIMTNGANLKLQNENKETPIDIAIRLRHSEIIKSTLKCSADINILNGNTKALKLLTSDVTLHTCLCNNIIMRDCANLEIPRRPRKIFAGLKTRFEDFYIECRNELEKLKSTKIGNSNITYYDILKQNVRKLSKSAENSTIIEIMETGDHRSKFPIYERMIDVNFAKALETKKLMNSAFSICNLLFSKLPKLPYVCVDYILSFMTNDDLTTFIAFHW